MPTVDRFRRPAQHEDLLNELSGKDGPFRTLVEALMFAAALGQRRNRREEFDKSGESIRLALMEGRVYGDVLIDMLAAVEVQQDPKILADDRLDDLVDVAVVGAGAHDHDHGRVLLRHGPLLVILPAGTVEPREVEPRGCELVRWVSGGVRDALDPGIRKREVPAGELAVPVEPAAGHRAHHAARIARAGTAAHRGPIGGVAGWDLRTLVQDTPG
jgi:hypothetical protein